jgi:hypothetical protein
MTTLPPGRVTWTLATKPSGERSLAARSEKNKNLGRAEVLLWLGCRYRKLCNRLRGRCAASDRTSLFEEISGFRGGGTAPARRSVKTIDAALNQTWSGKRDSNSRPRPWQGRALPTELFPRGTAHITDCPTGVNPRIRRRGSDWGGPSAAREGSARLRAHRQSRTISSGWPRRPAAFRRHGTGAGLPDRADRAAPRSQ